MNPITRYYIYVQWLRDADFDLVCKDIMDYVDLGHTKRREYEILIAFTQSEVAETAAQAMRAYGITYKGPMTTIPAAFQ